MAWTDRYVTTTGTSGHGGTNDTTDAWDFKTGWQAVGTGIRLNIKSGNYSISAGGTSIDTLGTATTTAGAWIRGYASTIGDLTYSRDSNGDLVTTGMPVITLSAGDRLRFLGDGVIVEGLKITGNRSNELLYAYSNWGYIYNCYVDNAYNLGFSSSSAISSAGYQVTIACCDAIRSGTDTAYTIIVSAGNTVYGCKIKGNGVCSGIGAFDSATIVDNVIYNCTAGVDWLTTQITQALVVANCTFYNCNVAAIQMYNNARASQIVPVAINCHATDCGAFIKNLYTGAACPMVMIGNRTRDNTSANNNQGDWPITKALTTDNGTYTSDYIDATTGNLFLRPTAVGRATGLIRNRDIGGTQAPSSSNSVF